MTYRDVFSKYATLASWQRVMLLLAYASECLRTPVNVRGKRT